MSLRTLPHSRPPDTPKASPGRQTAPRSHLHWPSINIPPAGRAGRIALGVAAVITAVVLLASAVATHAVVLEVLLLGAGLDLAITGALGHCPFYRLLFPPGILLDGSLPSYGRPSADRLRQEFDRRLVAQRPGPIDDDGATGMSFRDRGSRELR
ncbi:MAG: DUF2892 domain-containing protein [Candidatus Dormibacteraeota bacterium]|nr:DUF2892 domain-containing protein [Candidatus Dormibacteraeota bacterium]